MVANQTQIEAEYEEISRYDRDDFEETIGLWTEQHGLRLTTDEYGRPTLMKERDLPGLYTKRDSESAEDLTFSVLAIGDEGEEAIASGSLARGIRTRRLIRQAVLELMERYMLRGAQFPVSDVVNVVSGKECQLAIEVVAGASVDRDGLERLGSSIDDLRSLLQDWSAWEKHYPDLDEALEWLQAEIVGPVSHLVTHEGLLADAGWELDQRTKRVKAKGEPGIGNRPRELKNHLICRLYDILHPPFKAGWPIPGQDANPLPLRVHIAKILWPIFMGDISPRPHGPIWQAIRNHLKGI